MRNAVPLKKFNRAGVNCATHDITLRSCGWIARDHMQVPTLKLNRHRVSSSLADLGETDDVAILRTMWTL